MSNNQDFFWLNIDYTIGWTLIWRFNFSSDEILVKDNKTIYYLLCLSMLFVVDRDRHCFKLLSYCQWFKSIVRTRIFKLPEINLNRTGDILKWRLKSDINVWKLMCKRNSYEICMEYQNLYCLVFFLVNTYKWNHNSWNQLELYIHCRLKFYVENYVNCCTWVYAANKTGVDICFTSW